MKIVGRADVHRVDVLPGDHLSIVRVDVRVREVRQKPARVLGHDVAQRDHLYVVHFQIGRPMGDSEDAAASDHAHAKSIHE